MGLIYSIYFDQEAFAEPPIGPIDAEYLGVGDRWGDLLHVFRLAEILDEGDLGGLVCVPFEDLENGETSIDLGPGLR